MENIYTKDGICYIREIKGCRVTGTLGREIVAECSIKGLGTWEYLYDSEKKILRRPYKGGHREYMLDEKAADTVIKEYDVFMERVKNAENAVNREDISIEFMNIYEVFSFIREDEEYFTYLREVVYKEDGYIGSRELIERLTLPRIIDRLAYTIGDLLPDPGDDGSGFIEMKRMIRSRKKDDIRRNPLFDMAKKYGDVHLEKQLKVLYGIEDEDDCRWLSERTGKRVLPPFPGEKGKKIFVLRDTMNEEDIEMLERSGYRIYHKPYFALKDFSKSAWSIDPFAKKCVDAAPKGSEMISFDEFLKMFEPS